MQTQTISLQAAEKVLHALQRWLHERLEQPLSWDIKRQVIKSLVKQIYLETLVGADGKKAVRVCVTYRFGDVMALCKIFPSLQTWQKHQEGQEHMCWGWHRGLGRGWTGSVLSRFLSSPFEGMKVDPFSLRVLGRNESGSHFKHALSMGQPQEKPD